MEILTGPKGGKYYLDEKGKKHYIKKGTDTTGLAKTSNSNKEVRRNNSGIHVEERKVPEMRKLIIPVADYEHSGDLDHEEHYLKEKYPFIKVLRKWEERDYEAESEYEQDYGECDEPIYQGYLEIELPSDKINEVCI